MDLDALRDFADGRFDLTSPLTHAQVTSLAEYWVPRLSFHEEERFHPIPLGDLLGPPGFRELSPAEEPEWQVPVFQQSSQGTADRFDPALVMNPDGRVSPPAPDPDPPDPRSPWHNRPWDPQRDSWSTVDAFIVLGHGPDAASALSLPEAGGDTVITHGGTRGSSEEFFAGSTDDPDEPAGETNPRLPRQQPITVHAKYTNLLELLEYEVFVELTFLDDQLPDYPADALRRGFAAFGVLVYNPSQDPTVPRPDPETIWRRRIEQLRDIIAAQLANRSLPDLDPGWSLDRDTWNAIASYAFLEFDFIYAYNDFDRYESGIFPNHHEGDNEGCCLVFDRRTINLAAAHDDLRSAVPVAILTTVHEPWQKADLYREVIVSPTSPGDPAPPGRELYDPKVYIAAGSHATYLDPGDHDLVDFQDYLSYIGESAGLTIAAILFAPVAAAVLIVLAIYEHFNDTQDHTSDNGAHGLPPGIPPGGDDSAVPIAVHVVPQSADNHIYLPRNDADLRLWAFPGTWGRDDGLINHSPAFTPKTGRYLSRLLEGL